MLEENDTISAGLVFLGYKRIDLLAAAQRVATALEALDEKVRAIQRPVAARAQIETARHRIRLTLREDVKVPTLRTPADVVLRIEIAPRDSARIPAQPGHAADALLAEAARVLHDHFRPAYVQWVEPGAVLSSADFVMATTFQANDDEAPCPRTPRAKQPHAPLPEIEKVHDKLDHRLECTPPPAPPRIALPFEEIDGTLDGIIEKTPEQTRIHIESIRDDNDKLRLSAWLLSIAVACIAFPVGLTLMIINLVKGENLRLVSQTAAMAGLFVSFEATGATAQAIETVQNVLN